MMSTVLANRILVARTAFLGAIAATVLTLVSGRDYSADFSFTPLEANPSGISALASGIGLNMGSGGPQSPPFYVDLLRSRQILGAILDQRFTHPSDTGNETGRLADLLSDDKGKPAVRKTKALARLRTMITTRADMKTGLVSVSVTSDSPEFAQQLASSLLAELHKFNVASRRLDAVEERDFAKLRMDQGADSLRHAEDARQRFGERNRYYNNSPELQREQVRLDREVSLLTGQYNSYVLSYEHARTEAERKNPVITIVDRPEVPALPDARHLIAKTVLGMAFGAMIALLIAFTRTSPTRRRTGPVDESAEYELLRAAMIADFRNPGRIVRQLFSWRRGHTIS